MNPSKINELKAQVANGDIDEAIQYLLNHLEEVPKEKWQREINLLSSRWEQWQATQRSGTEDSDALQVQRNNIDLALLSLLDKIATADAPAKNRKKRIRNFFIILGGIIAALAGIAEITGYNAAYFLQKKVTTIIPVDTTVTETDTFPEKEDKENPISPPPPQPQPKTVKPTIENSTPTKVEKLRIKCATNMGRENLEFKEGEQVEIYYQVNKPCHVRIIYKLADGQLILLYNDVEVKANQLNQRLLLSTFDVASPFGKEQLYCFAQSAAFPKLTTHWEDGYEFIDEGLPKALQKTRGLKKTTFLAEDSIDILTVE